MYLFQRIFEAMPDALLVVSAEGTIVRANEQAARSFGYTQAELIGLTIERLIPERFAGRHLRHRIAYSAAPRSRPMGAGHELFALRKDGSEFPVDIMLSPLTGTNGASTLCVLRDISERARLQENFRALLESAPDAIVIARESGQIVFVNQQAEVLFGYTRNELLERPIELLIPPRFRSGHPAQRARYFSAPVFRPMGVGIKLSGLRKNGDEFPVEVSLSPLQTSQGMLVSSAIRDISERLKAEEALNSLRATEAILKEIHHRVKNNMAVISSLLYLQSTATSHVESQRVLRECQDRVRSMGLVHEMLYATGHFQSIDFAAYASALCDRLLHTYAVTSNRIRLNKDLQSTAMPMEIAVPFGLILNELITNALRHAFPNGRAGSVCITLSTTEGAVRNLSVTDSGIGLPQDFDYANATTLGLRIIRTLVNQIDGAFSISSTHSGTQARVSVRYAQ